MGKPNKPVLLYSTIALIFLILAFTTHWTFIILAAIFSGIGWRKIMKS